MRTRKKISEDPGYPGLLSLLLLCGVGGPIFLLLITFDEARNTLFNLSGKPRSATVTELRGGKIGAYTWVATKGVRWNDNYVIETRTSTNKRTGSNFSYSSAHFLLISPDDPELKKWKMVKALLEEAARRLDKKDKAIKAAISTGTGAGTVREDQTIGAIAQEQGAEKLLDSLGADGLEGTLMMAEITMKQFKPTQCVCIVGAAPEKNKLSDASFGSEINPRVELNTFLHLLEDEATVTGMVGSVPDNIQQQFRKSGVAAPTVEIGYGEPNRAEFNKFLGAALILLIEGLTAWLFYLHKKSRQ